MMGAISVAQRALQSLWRGPAPVATPEDRTKPAKWSPPPAPADDALPPGRELYDKVRAGFIAQGRTMRSWCTDRGINQSNARAALCGSWNGPKARALRAEMIRAAGLAEGKGEAA